MTISLRQAERLARQAKKVPRKPICVRIPTEMVDRMQRSSKPMTDIVNKALVEYYSKSQDQTLSQAKQQREQIKDLVARMEVTYQPTSDGMYDMGFSDARGTCLVYLKRILACQPIAANMATSPEPTGLRANIVALVARWQEPIGTSFDEPAYDRGRDAGRQGCADQLLDTLETMQGIRND